MTPLYSGNGEKFDMKHIDLIDKEAILFKLTGKLRCPECKQNTVYLDRVEQITDEYMFYSLKSECHCMEMMHIVNAKGQWKLYWTELNEHI